MPSYAYTLPVEQWRHILANVSLGDLCNVVLTSRHMNSVASLPELWAGMKVNLAKVMDNGLAEFYNINRFKKVKRMNFEEWDWEGTTCEEWERLLKEIPGSPLEDANLTGANLSGVSSEILASAVSHLHMVNLHKTGLTTDQCAELLKASCSSTTLSTVNLESINLGKVPSEILARSISRLKYVNLHGTWLKTDQCVELLKASLSSATLTKLNLVMVNLSQVPAELLASSINRLFDVNLMETGLTTDQCIAFLKASLSSITLTKVNLAFVDLSQVPAELLASSISRLEDVNLCGTWLKTDQSISLLKASLASTTLTNVILSAVNLSQVPAELLGSSISRLEYIRLRKTDLTTDQCIALLKASLSSTTLTTIDLLNVDLSKVPLDLLARSISRLEVVRIHKTDLTTDQCIALLNAIPSNTTLRRIILGVNEIKQESEREYLLASVPPHVRVRLR